MALSIPHLTYIPLPSDSGGKHPDHEAVLLPVPIHIVTHASQLPKEFLVPSPKTELVIGFDCEGVGLCRYGAICIMQLAFPDAIYLVDAIKGGKKLMKACKPALESNYITKVIHDCKRDSEALYFQHGIKLHNVMDTQVMDITSLVEEVKNVLFWSLKRQIGLEATTVETILSAIKETFVQLKNLFFNTKSTVLWRALDNLLLFEIAYSLIDEQQGQARSLNEYISFVGLLADPRYCGISYFEKKEVRVLLRQDPYFWACRPFSEVMVRAAADDVRFLPYIYHKMMEKVDELSLWKLAVRGVLYCRCFCNSDVEYADWPPLPAIPGNLVVAGNAPEEEILSVLHVPSGKMGRVIGRKGASILSVKEWCNAEILLGGAKGPLDKVFIIGPIKHVRKAEAILRGRM